MRIISGSARGTHIEAPEGHDTRPVTDKIRQSLFNIWQWDIPGSHFLDVFSGSGSMGLEALSRGADRVVMIEKAPKAVKVINQNIKKCHLENKNVQVLAANVFTALPALHEKFDIIYLDPPYTVDEIFQPVMELLGSLDLLNEDGIVVIRTRKEKEMDEEYGRLEKYRDKVYGISRAHFYRLKEKES
ncbi:16S rRNA (guanine(966)-N(2))-methyltransferase RsmD [uncultured Dubosiella sp.]|mgnify:CR=1 FL=1|uniref:16S rRNA (guanine(966)-N(2))-methyltransferase RsmD n=1 Tax=uncultured Dubosiella sp. TaxID=1937011 RepID=UPI00208DA06D|nr:16S rRNA (guanine(966)-N(2))-methyltransferase RsmD [uncultured Dubosiella sp.]GJM56842.1 RNA methyltransferase [Erysipelotrichaceae bacterium OPF54]